MKSREGGTMVGTTLLVGLVFGLSSNGVRAAPSPEAPSVETDSESRSVEGIVVKVDGPEVDAETTRGWIEERAVQVLDKEGVAPLEEGALIRIAVHGIAYDYRISLTLARGRRLLEQPAEIVCECGSDEMLDRVAEAIEDGVRVLAEVAAEERAAATVRAELIRREVERREEERKQEEERLAREQAGYRPSPMGRAGLGVGGLGAVALIAGVVMVSVKERPIADADHLLRDYRPLGFALLSVGAVALTTGVTMIALDVTRCRRSNGAGGCSGAELGAVGGSRRRRFTPAVGFSAEQVAVSLQGRF